MMIFVACRAADALNVFVGLWLVPKYVEPAELGAVMPLTNFANFLAIPIAVFASTFRNELTTLTINRKFGQMKTLIRGVFIATAVLLFLAIVICRLILPFYLERIRVAEGSLALVIIITSFISAIAPIYNNALQSLKKFKASSALAIAGAPRRLMTLGGTMPRRALPGSFVGQCAVPASQIVGSVFCLRKELSVPAEPYWNREIVRRFGGLVLIFGIDAIVGGFSSLVESTVLRQRLPEIDSAAYYMVTRFSDIAGFLASTLVFTLFPFAAELAAKGKDTRPLILKTSAAVFISNAALAAFFWFFGERIIAFLPHGSEYAAFWWAIPWLIAITSINLFTSFYGTGEVSAFRFGYMKWFVPLTLLYPAALLFVTGYGYFTAYLPASWTNFLATHNVASLSTMLWWMTGIAALKALGCVLSMLRQKPHCAPKPDVLSYPYAEGTGIALHDGQPHDGGGLHPFTSRRERVFSDLSCIRVLAETLESQSSGASDSSPRDSLRKIVDCANSCGLFITVPAAPSPRGVVTAATPRGALHLGELISKRTGESEVYFNAAEHAYYKVKWPSAKAHIKQTSPRDWFYEHIIHNILFPDTAYEFIGITEEVGELKIILRQQEVPSERFPSDAQVAAHLATLGLKPEDRYFFGNDLLAVTDVSSTSDNVLLDDVGNLRFIDPLIRLKKPASEIIAILTGAPN
ncbi:MAG: hypothetical protein KBT68_12760 [bacterium]|nr:hypothetical protein [Candidatus Colisoma equi]